MVDAAEIEQNDKARVRNCESIKCGQHSSALT